MADVFGTETSPDNLTEEERMRRFFAGTAPSRPNPVPPQPTTIDRPGDVTPGIGRARAEVAATPPDQTHPNRLPPPSRCENRGPRTWEGGRRGWISPVRLSLPTSSRGFPGVLAIIMQSWGKRNGKNPGNWG